MSEGVEVEYLPTIGEPYSMRTNKQGRTLSVSKTILLDDMIKGIPSHKRKLKRRQELTLSELNSIAGRIIRFNKSDIGDIERARAWIDNKSLENKNLMLRSHAYLTRRFYREYFEA